MKRHALLALAISLALAFDGSQAAEQRVRIGPQRVTGKCLATMLSQFEFPPTAFEVGNIVDYTGVSLSGESIPLEVSYQVRSALSILSRAIGVVEAGVELRKVEGLAVKNFKVDGGITQADVNTYDSRRQRDAGISFGGGKAQTNLGGRTDANDGDVAGCLVLQAYSRDGGFGLSSVDSTSEVCFSVNRSTRGSEWAVTIGPLSFGSAQTSRSNVAVHQVIRVAVDMAITQMIGRAFGVPYWACAPDVFPVDSVVVDDLVANVSSMDDTTLDAFRAKALEGHGYASYQTTRAMQDASDALCQGDGNCYATEAEQLAWLYLYRPIFDEDVTASGAAVTRAPRKDWRGPGVARQSTPVTLERTRTPERVSGKEPPYPASARQAGIEGDVLARVTVDPAGRVVDVWIVESDARGAFDDTVIRTVKKWRFDRDHLAIDDREVTVPFTFRLRS